MSHVRLAQKLQNRNHFITKDALFFITERQDDTFFFIITKSFVFWWFKTMWAGVFMSEILHQVIREHFLELLSWDVAVVSSFFIPSDNIQRVMELLCAE